MTLTAENHQAATGTVVTLVAEVRTLMVGSRQVTLSVFNQLDKVDYDLCEPMGRVNPREPGRWVVGRHTETGVLVRATFDRDWPYFDRHDEADLKGLRHAAAQAGKPLSEHSPQLGTYRPLTAEQRQRLAELETALVEMPRWQREYKTAAAEHDALPLIVLAGLR